MSTTFQKIGDLFCPIIILGFLHNVKEKTNVKNFLRFIISCLITGYMSTKMKDVIYLKDPPLFDATRPTRKNPH